jgi:hypothetical protein
LSKLWTPAQFLSQIGIHPLADDGLKLKLFLPMTTIAKAFATVRLPPSAALQFAE